MRNANWGNPKRGRSSSFLRFRIGNPNVSAHPSPTLRVSDWSDENTWILISRIHFAHTSTLSLRYFSNTIDHLWLFSDCNIILRIAPLAYKTSLVLEPLFQKTDRTQFPKYDLCEHYVFSAECAWGTLHYFAICYIQCMHRDCHRFEVLMLRQYNSLFFAWLSHHVCWLNQSWNHNFDGYIYTYVYIYICIYGYNMDTHYSTPSHIIDSCGIALHRVASRCIALHRVASRCIALLLTRSCRCLLTSHRLSMCRSAKRHRASTLRCHDPKRSMVKIDDIYIYRWSI